MLTFFSFINTHKISVEVFIRMPIYADITDIQNKISALSFTVTPKLDNKEYEFITKTLDGFTFRPIENYTSDFNHSLVKYFFQILVSSLYRVIR